MKNKKILILLSLPLMAQPVFADNIMDSKVKCSEYQQYKNSHFSGESNSDITGQIISNYSSQISHFAPPGVDKEAIIESVMDQTDEYCNQNPDAMLVPAIKKFMVQKLKEAYTNK